MFEDLIVDIETDGIKPTLIHMVGILDYHTDEYTSYIGPERIGEAMVRMMEARTLIGHHIEGYDLKHMTRLTEGLADFSDQEVICTLKLSKKHCDLVRHGLEAWGEMFGFPKLPSPRWDVFTPQMDTYCERDVRLNKLVTQFLFERAGIVLEHRQML